MTEKMTYTGPHFIIGAIGAASHGKTELLRAILYVQAKKGLADYGSYNDLIDLAEPGEITTVEYKSQHNCFYTHIDCAGGDEYTENMVYSADGVRDFSGIRNRWCDVAYL